MTHTGWMVAVVMALGLLGCAGDSASGANADGGLGTGGTNGTNPDGDGTLGSDDTGFGTVDNSSSGDSACGETTVDFAPVIPTVVLLIDQSSSMDGDFGDASRWDTVRSALLDETTGIVKQLQDVVRFGLALYSSRGGFEGGTCPMLTEVSASLNNYQAIADTFFGADPINDTPTGESVLAVAEQLAKLQLSGPKIIVLATDGEPDSCEVPNPQEGQAESVASATQAFALGIKTYIISVGADVTEGHMQDMANAGLGVTAGGPNAPFYQALDQAALIAAFEKIIYGSRSCTLALDGAVTEGQEDQCRVTVDGQSVPLGDANGWRQNNPSEIELLGSSCQAIQAGVVEVEVSCPCGAVTLV